MRACRQSRVQCPAASLPTTAPVADIPPLLSNIAQRSVVAFLGLKVLVLTANMWWFPTLTADQPTDSPTSRSTGARQPRAALLVPVRNEIGRLASTLPAMLTAGFHEVLFLDDESTDGTAQWLTTALNELVDRSGPVTVVAGRPRPAGWVGKT